jgi:hypothetical protein
MDFSMVATSCSFVDCRGHLDRGAVLVATTGDRRGGAGVLATSTPAATGSCWGVCGDLKIRRSLSNAATAGFLPQTG